MAAKTPAKKTATTKTTAKKPATKDATAEATEQVSSLVEQGQTLARDGLKAVSSTVSDTVAKMPTISIPADFKPSELVDSYFEFAEKVLARQREFADKAVALAAKR